MSEPKPLEEVWEQKFVKLKKAARELRLVASTSKANALRKLADNVEDSAAELLAVNQKDLAQLPVSTTAAFRDRLALNPARILAMVESLRKVAALPDPVGEVIESRTLDNGLLVRRVRAPLGVLFMIFESRPNVVLEAFSLAFQSGNVIALRGGSESRATVSYLYQLMRKTLSEMKIDENFFLGFDDYDRDLVATLLRRKDLIDVVIPRGGDKLIEFVQNNSLMPIIKNDRGLCHAYIDNEADLDMAVNLVVNGKTQRPGVCNSLETVLVNHEVAGVYLPKLFRACDHVDLEWHCDSDSIDIFKQNGLSRNIKLAQPEDWNTEYLDLILNCKIVKNLEEALAHIDRYGSKHSELIVTASPAKARHFQNEVDAAATYWNASTRFTDGFELGLGGELGISTQKLHVRGPVGLRELTTPRWLIEGRGQVRGG